MMRAIAATLAAGLAALATADDLSSDRVLLAQAASLQVETQAVPAVPPPERPADAQALDVAERQARGEANLALAKLELIQARKALRAERYEQAAQQARHVLELLRDVPAEVDAQEYELQAEGVLVRAARHGVDVQAIAAGGDAAPPAAPPDARLDRQAQAAAKISRQYSGPPRSDIDSSGDPARLRERTLRRQMPDAHGYRPGRAIVDVDALQTWSEQSLPYQGALQEAYRADEVQMLVEADEARVVPERDVTYPADWPERVARRQKYADGVVARTPSWTDEQGREWYIAVYDIHDLIYVPPDFGLEGQFFGDLFTGRNVADRAAFRDYMFQGLAWGYVPPEEAIPLLRYFGGVNAWIDRGPKYSLERQQEIVNLIEAFVGGHVRTLSDVNLPPEPPPLPPEPLPAAPNGR